MAPPSAPLADAEPHPRLVWAVLAMAVVAAVILAVSLQRHQIGFSTEMDFTTTYGPEAQRVLAGEPLLLEYHPPGYPFMAAFGKTLAGGWLAAGLWLSGLAAIVVLVVSFLMFRRLAGPAAAWGALIACACSSPFLTFASMTTSDMPFAALVCAALACAVSGMHRGGIAIWMAAGFIAALAYLTRSNGIAMAALIVAPLIVRESWGTRVKHVAATALAFAVPVLTWALYAHATHSPFSPTDNYLNLAVAAYGDGENPFGEEAMDMEERFHSTLDVLAYDTMRMVRQLSLRLLKLPYLLASTLTWLPVGLLAIPGLYLILRKRPTAPWLYYFAVLLGLIALSGLAPYRTRFFIFVIPVLGALAAVAVTHLVNHYGLQPKARHAVDAAVLIAAAIVLGVAFPRVAARLETPAQIQFAEAIPQVQALTPSNALAYASSYTLSFETGREGELIPDVETVAQLHEELCDEVEPAERPFLYIGSKEREAEFRRELAKELAQAPVPWLEKVAGSATSQWTLYRIILDDCPG